MSSGLSFNFLLGFIAFFVCLALILTIGFKSESISFYDRKRFNRSRMVIQLVWLTPFLFAYLYLLLAQDASLNEFLMLVFLPAVFLLGGEYLFFRPKLNVFIISIERLYNSIKLEPREPRYGFNAETDKLVLNRDRLVYMRGYLVDISLDRVCKNNFGEYFWIQPSANKSSQATIEHIATPDVIRNLLRANRNVYLQEFNEEPYFRNK